MEDLLSTPNFEENMFAEQGSNLPTEIDPITQQISELSKKGYQLLKENDIEGAEAAFREILKIEDNNNYALVGLGDSAR